MQHYTKKKSNPLRLPFFNPYCSIQLLYSILKLLIGNDLLCKHVSTGLGALNHLNDLGH